MLVAHLLSRLPAPLLAPSTISVAVTGRLSNGRSITAHLVASAHNGAVEWLAAVAASPLAATFDRTILVRDKTGRHMLDHAFVTRQAK
eukprot:520539-Prymnesium_polylepis.1